MEGDGFKTTKSPQNTRGENIGAEIVDAGPILTEQLLRNGEEIFESEETGKSYVLNEKQRRRINAKVNKQDSMQAKLLAAQNIQLEADGTWKPNNIKPNVNKQQTQPLGKDKAATAMLESQQTVLTATAKSHGLKANTHQDAIHALKSEKKQDKKEKVAEKKEKRKHAKAEESRRQHAKEHENAPKL